jgi:MtN3 and saliva related transmembrane protein
MIDAIGSVAAFLTTVAVVPQVVKIWRSRSAKDISLSMYVVFTLGVAMWLVYGLLLGAVPIIVANCVTLLLAVLVIVMRLRWSSHRRDCCKKKESRGASVYGAAEYTQDKILLYRRTWLVMLAKAQPTFASE